MEKRDKIDHGYNIEIISCPSCLEESAKVVSHILDIPYYDDFAIGNNFQSDFEFSNKLC